MTTSETAPTSAEEIPRDAAETADEELARRAQAGSSSAFAELLRRWQPTLLRFFAQRAAQADAEDLFQETAVKAYRHLHRYAATRPFKAWIFAVAYRTAVDHGRRFRPPAVALDVDPPGREDSPLDAASGGADLWGLARRLLDEESYRALWLHYVERLTTEEVAEVLGRSRAWVKTRLHRARERLRPHLAE